MLNDLRFILRSWARSKKTAAVLLLSLGLGTGANVVLYNTMHALLFEPPPWPSDPSRLATVFTSQYNGSPLGLSSFEDFESADEDVAAFVAMAAFEDSLVAPVRVGNATEHVRIAAVSNDFFATLGLGSHLDGALGTAHDGSSNGRAIVSHAFWTALGKPDQIEGAVLRIGDSEYRIAGIAPEGFAGLQRGRACDVWIPLGPEARARGRGARRLGIIGRLANGFGMESAQRQLAELSERLAASFPATNRGTLTDPDEPRRMTALSYSPLDASSRRQMVVIGTVVSGATCLLLLSACLNSGTLLLLRSETRRRELAIKLALGASRTILVRQIVLEGMMVATAGAAVGLLIAYWAGSVLPAMFAPEDAASINTTLDAPRVLIILAVSCFVGVLFAIAPSRHATRTVDVDVLRADSGAVSSRGGRPWGRTVLVTGQIALSTVMIVAAAFLVRTLSEALEAELSRHSRRVASALVRLPGVRQGDVARGIRFHTRVTIEAHSMDDVQAAGWIATLPMGRGISQTLEFDIGREGLREVLDVEVNVASSGSFHTMNVPLVEGRLFDAGDGALARPVVVVNDILAERVFGSAAVGRAVRDAEGTAYEIVGVVRSGRHRTFQTRAEPMVYFPLSQRTPEYMHLVLRASGPPERLTTVLAGRLLAIDGGASVERVIKLEEHLNEALMLDRVLTTLVACCGLAVLLMATLGVYGIIDDQVRKRIPEIGLRAALGASHWEIRRLVVTEGLAVTAIGSAAGVGLAFALARSGRVLVDGLPALGLTSVAVVPVALTLVVLGGAALPIRRALAVSPMLALRGEA